MPFERWSEAEWERYAKRGEGRWVTINGTHVFIKNGKITKGPAEHLVNLKEEQAGDSDKGTVHKSGSRTTIRRKRDPARSRQNRRRRQPKQRKTGKNDSRTFPRARRRTSFQVPSVPSRASSAAYLKLGRCRASIRKNRICPVRLTWILTILQRKADRAIR